MSDEESKELNKEQDIINIFRTTKLNEFLDKVRKWKNEGKTKEEVLELMDRRILTKEDIEKIYQEPDNNEKENEEEVFFINDDIVEPIEYEKMETEDTDKKEFAYLKDEELIDYENQPFITDNEEDNKELISSIKVNGIIEPIIVRKYLRKIPNFVRT